MSRKSSENADRESRAALTGAERTAENADTERRAALTGAETAADSDKGQTNGQAAYVRKDMASASKWRANLRSRVSGRCMSGNFSPANR